MSTMISCISRFGRMYASMQDILLALYDDASAYPCNSLEAKYIFELIDRLKRLQ